MRRTHSTAPRDPQKGLFENRGGRKRCCWMKSADHAHAASGQNLLRVITGKSHPSRSGGEGKAVQINVRRHLRPRHRGSASTELIAGQFREGLVTTGLQTWSTSRCRRSGRRREEHTAFGCAFPRANRQGKPVRGKIYAPEAVELLATAESGPANIRQLYNVVRQKRRPFPRRPSSTAELVAAIPGGKSERGCPSFDEAARDEFTPAIILSQILQITGGQDVQPGRAFGRNATATGLLQAYLSRPTKACFRTIFKKA